MFLVKSITTSFMSFLFSFQENKHTKTSLDNEVRYIFIPKISIDWIAKIWTEDARTVFMSVLASHYI